MKAVLDQIKPSLVERKRVLSVTTSFLKRLNAQLKDGKAILGGSGAKGTWLSGNHDLDIFVIFPRQKYATRSSELADLLQPLLRRLFTHHNLQRLNGSRDYFQLVDQGFNIEIVPIVSITKAEQAINITDISPLHTRWVNKQPVSVKDQVLLAKQFCKAQGLYGAESYITGFSGYVLEILISHYGSFERLLKASQKWKRGEVVDSEKHYPLKNALFHLNQSKVQSPLIVIDPVDKNRNAAAALSFAQFSLFQRRAREYLLKPSPDFFVKKVLTAELWQRDLQQRSRHGLWLDLLLPEGKEDVVGVKLVKALNFLQQELQSFGLCQAGWIWDKSQVAALYLELENGARPAIEVRPGPPLKLTEHVADFRKKNKNTFVQEDRIMANVPVAFPLLKDSVRQLLKHAYFRQRITEVKRILVF